MSRDLLLIGKVGRPHGVQGKISVVSYAQSPGSFDSQECLYLKRKDGTTETLHIEEVSAVGQKVVLAVREITSREAAEAIVGCDLYMDKEGLPGLPEGEYYQYELVGLQVETTAGVKLGRIRGILETGSTDILVIKEGKREHLIPALKEIIREIDIAGGRMVIEPLENMIEEA